MKNFLVVIGITGMILACTSKPKVIEAENASPETQQPMVDESASKLHKVVVQEVLNTTKYSYLNVTEGGEAFWIAIPKKDIEKGGTYYYRGGLKKTNFQSAEYDRVFETLYLVSDVSKDPGMGGMSGMSGGNPHANISNTIPADPNVKITPPAGGISINELFTNRKKYDGQTVKIKGKCVKLNNMIMNRNWIHLQDGSSKDAKIDLTVTTTEDVPLGAIVTVEGKIALNKDFGAGYKYEIIMEEAQIIP